MIWFWLLHPHLSSIPHQEVTQRILEAVGGVAGSSLEQTSWLSRNLEVKVQPQVCPVDEEPDDVDTDIDLYGNHKDHAHGQTHLQNWAHTHARYVQIHTHSLLTSQNKLKADLYVCHRILTLHTRTHTYPNQTVISGISVCLFLSVGRVTWNCLDERFVTNKYKRICHQQALR